MQYIFKFHRMFSLETNCACVFTEEASILISEKIQKLKLCGATFAAAQELTEADSKPSQVMGVPRLWNAGFKRSDCIFFFLTVILLNNLFTKSKLKIELLPTDLRMFKK